jgi:coenzyme F420-0:L-glutamate ligase/coenzyme F420-1:gamma-L-glutamate ligase
MELHSFLRSRRSVRRFRVDPVPAEVLERILETATFAPSAHNRQPWRFAVLTDSSHKSRLADGMALAFQQDLESGDLSREEVETQVEKSRSRINSAPVVVVLCMDMAEMDVYPDARRSAAEHTMAIQSAANAGLQFLLGVFAEGLGGVWNCAPLFAPAAVSRALGLPDSWEPQAMFLVGFPAENPEAKPRKSIQEVSIFK